MTHFEATLYINHSTGKTGSWQVQVDSAENNTARITTKSWRVVGGNPVVNIKDVVQGKNIGRANETTPIEQAVSEAQSTTQKKMDKGYTYDMPKAGQVATNGLGLTKPMLAYEMSKVGELTYPVFIQPKLDGNRCLAARIGGEIRLWSRGGKWFDLPHIAQALESILIDENVILDGELYVHGETLQTINSWIKKARPETPRIQYHVYDTVLNEAYQARLCHLKSLIDDANPHIVLCKTDVVHNEEELMAKHSKWVAAGYEGSIVRDGHTPYQPRRSKSLVKVKDFQDAEFTVLSVVPGTPRTLQCGTQLQCAIYECCAANGKTFRVTAPGDMHAKHDAFLNAVDAIGKPLTVKFFNLTKDGLPFLPVAIDLRPTL